MAYGATNLPGGGGQAISNVQRVEHAIPFGTATGDLISSGEYLIFVDDQERQNSFAISRNSATDVRQDGASVTITLARPVKTRAGEMSSVVFRFINPEGVRMLSGWMGAAVAPAIPGETMAFQVRRKRLIGGDEGRLTIAPTDVDYRSMTNFKASRRWKMSEIKEVKRDNPHALTIVPFSGEQYSFEIIGQGLTSDQYNRLVDHIMSQRQ